jgi:type VI protein secretion system component VasK
VNSFSDFFWLLIWAFVLGCYLVVLFQIVVDLFRDEDLSGWGKAAWIIFLIIVPFLSALVYVIVRGRGMAERHQAARTGGRATEAPYVPPPIMKIDNPAGQIATAQQLLDSGTISQAEFDHLKQKAMG